MTTPTRPIRALIFSVSIGSGHDSVARALAEELVYQVPGSTVEIVDTFQYINSVLHKVVVGSYMETLKFTPKVWGYLYDQAEDGERLVDLGQILSKVLSPKLELLLKETNPDVIITTHAFPTGMLAVLKQRGQIKVPLAAVVTDFHVHAFWIHHGVDLYFLPAPDLDFPLVQYGIQRESIFGVGIPIRRQFAREIDAEDARTSLLPGELPIALVMGGGLGLGRIESIVKELLQSGTFRVTVVAGKNKRLQETLSNLQDERLKVFGFVEDMARLMAASQLVISKPGGVTTAEILAMQKPLIIFSSLPGQEDRNTDYLLNKGAAIKVRKLEMLIQEVLALWHSPLRLRHMKEMAAVLGSPRAGSLVWENIWPYVAK